MKNKYLALLLSIFLINAVNSQEGKFDPWGVWNFVPFDISTAKTTILSTGKYYSAGQYNAVYIVPNGTEIMAGSHEFPCFAGDDAITEIEKYEMTDYGILFYAIGLGLRHHPVTGEIEFQENTRIPIKMIFTNEDECTFEYMRTDAKGFDLSFFPPKNTYQRYRVEQEYMPDSFTPSQSDDETVDNDITSIESDTTLERKDAAPVEPLHESNSTSEINKGSKSYVGTIIGIISGLMIITLMCILRNVKK